MGKPKDSSATEISAELEALKKLMSGKFQEQEGTLDAGLEEIKEQLERIEGENFEARNLCQRLAQENSDLKNEVNDLHQELAQLEAYTRRDNLRFYQIPDAATEDTEQKLRNFITKKLKMDGESVDFSIVHRLGAFRAGQSRCILARFVRRNELTKVKAAAVNLRGTHFGVAEDLPTAWATARRQAHERFIKPARSERKKIRWRGARLFISDQEINFNSADKTDGTTPPRPRHSSHDRDINTASRSTSSTHTLTQSRANLTDQDD